MKKHTTFFLLLLCGCYSAFGQIKYEKEERIQKEELPVAVVQLLPLMKANAKRIRYYREFDGQSISYEVKFKKHGAHFSVEFNQEGVLEDVEVLVAKSALPTVVLETVKTHFQSVKLTRIQKQFVHPQGVNPVHTLRAVFGKYSSVKHDVLTKSAYEIVVSGKTQNGYQQFEVLVAPSGKLLKKSTILTKDYEHVVY